jgi:hypothetical protein
LNVQRSSDQDKGSMPSQAMRGATRDPRRGAIPVVPIRYRPFDELERTRINKDSLFKSESIGIEHEKT